MLVGGSTEINSAGSALLSIGILMQALRVLRRGEMFMLTLGGLHPKHAVQREIWIPIDRIEKNDRKP
jgi:hypothetical protein